MAPRVIAVDWSGATSGERRKIWLAESVDGRLIRLENGRNRTELADHVIAEAGRSPHLVVGLDFAFSCPAWFLQEQGCSSVLELWELVERQGEGWLKACDPPFWGRPGRKRPPQQQFRRTEFALPRIAGISPKSVFQIGGAGAVGTGSLRGMPLFRRLREQGFSIWPFDKPGWPRVVEIYPRVFTGAVRKSHQETRAQYLDRNHPSLSKEFRQLAASSEDAFDAAVSAIAMQKNLKELESLPEIQEPLVKLEGQIWSGSSYVG